MLTLESGPNSSIPKGVARDENRSTKEKVRPIYSSSVIPCIYVVSGVY